MQEPSSGNHTGPPADWLSRYGSSYHEWRCLSRGSRTDYYRPMGIVEGSFDTDGTDFEGRADLHCELTIEIRSLLSPDDLRRRILLAWAVLRSQHVLLSTRAINGAPACTREISSTLDEDRYFIVEVPQNLSHIVSEAARHMIYAAEKGSMLPIESAQFLPHILNTGRAIDPTQALAKLIVLPLQPLSNDRAKLHFMFVVAHQISDGLTIFRWMSHFVDLLNESTAKLELAGNSLCAESSICSRLPPAQESMYPPIPGTSARQRWSWLISRILRHTRHPPPVSFPNPLRRTHPLSKAEEMPEIFTGLLDYSKAPPLNTFAVAATLSSPATRKLARLCREARISIGAGSFALVGLVMMLFYERRHPEIPLNKRRPFVGSFPLNPRPFLAGEPTTGKEDSLMLAFSDGLTLPFLPSELPIGGRFKLLGRLAHRQLRIYQKHPRGTTEVVELGSRSPSQMIPSLYLGSVERMEAKAPPERKSGINPQGAYPARVSETGATCGVSSVGDRTKLIGSKYDVNDESKTFVADFRALRNVVRARDGEFLVGAAGDADSLGFSVSYDGCAIDPRLAEEWAEMMRTILLPVEEKIGTNSGPKL